MIAHRKKPKKSCPEKRISLIDCQDRNEETANAVTHGAGVLLSAAGLIVLLSMSARTADAWRIVSFSIYGSSLILLYLMSTLSHAMSGKAKKFFELMDFSAGYLLIAGSYTPITLIFLRGSSGWTFFCVIWGLAVFGILFKVFFRGRFNLAATLIYVAMGWLIVIAVKPLIAAVPRGFFSWLILGGVCYTVGTFFYLFKRLYFHHPVWHLFVLAGSVCHYLGFLLHGFGK